MCYRCELLEQQLLIERGMKADLHTHNLLLEQDVEELRRMVKEMEQQLAEAKRKFTE
jgi:hypothetical protein